MSRMRDFDITSRAGLSAGRSLPDVHEVIARAQRLIDSGPPAGSSALAWHVEAQHVGDLSAIAAIALRASRAD